MHTYTLTITKEDFLLEFKSTDNNIVEKELGVWIDAAVKLLEETEEQRMEELLQAQQEEPQLEKIELGSIILEKPQKPAPIIPMETQPEPTEEPTEEITEEVLPESIAEPEPVIAKASVKSKPKIIKSIEEISKIMPQELPVEKVPLIQEEPEPEIEEAPVAPRNIQKISDKTKEILQKAIHKPQPTMKEVLDEKPSPSIPMPRPTELVKPLRTASQYQQEQPLPTPAPVLPEAPEIPQLQDFTTVFNQKMMQENSRTDKFAQLLSLSNINNKFNCLIACAYHLVERENFERFTLKQINTISKALLEEAIEHDTLKEALEQRYIKIVPDYTGIASTMEYTLTDLGIKYFEREILE